MYTQTLKECKHRVLFSCGKIISGTYPTSLSSIAPGWKGGKLPPLGGSLGEYSLNDFDEQPAHGKGEGGVEGGAGGRRFRRDLDYFRFSSFKSQHHLSNLMLDDFVEIYWMGRGGKKRSQNNFLLLSLSNASSSIW